MAKKCRHFWQGVFTRKGMYVETCANCGRTRTTPAPKWF